MALDAALLADPGLPRGQGPAVLRRGRGPALQPAPAARYDVRDGIPVMLIDEARRVDDAEHDAPQWPHRRRGDRADVRRSRFVLCIPARPADRSRTAARPAPATTVEENP